MFERYPTNRSDLHNHLQPHRQLQEWGKGKRQIPVKQKALAEKQSLAAVWSINTLLAVIFPSCNGKLILLLLLKML